MSQTFIMLFHSSRPTIITTESTYAVVTVGLIVTMFPSNAEHRWPKDRGVTLKSLKCNFSPSAHREGEGRMAHNDSRNYWGWPLGSKRGIIPENADLSAVAGVLLFMCFSCKAFSASCLSREASSLISPFHVSQWTLSRGRYYCMALALIKSLAY